MYLVFFNKHNKSGLDCNSFEGISVEEIMYTISLERLLGNLWHRAFNMSGEEFGYWYSNTERFVEWFNDEEYKSGWWCITIDVDNFDEMWGEAFQKASDHLDEVGSYSVGTSVVWEDPAIEDYPEEEREERLNCIYQIVKIDDKVIGPSVLADDSEHIILISDGFSESEVYANELQLSPC